ncbi:MAG TPA: UDP-N-acetylglucosamine 2-epimerase (non-hydrolyzing) [Panacibacter sp.]|nr:UDP-N-acetylglucosamine 2-epimerase (non-hydrolyzing) [Panacibacter sp.]HNP45623.1 UDP-N-acetylglucosamine 2-epimerase (non-hydrolyzing) [Panacibacter sp.]
MKKILFVFGTRPEAIKMAPIIHEAKKHADELEVKVCVTGQHKEMLQQVMDFFQLTEDYNLHLMKPGQTLFDITADGLRALEKMLDDYTPDIMLVQGDTTTVFTAALAAFYKKIKIGHIEAGLRSFDKYSPFPEEINRKLTGALTDFHFAPTVKAKENLEHENIHRNIFVVGNTVIDALLWAVDKVRTDNRYQSFFSFLDPEKRTVLITGHRRESFGKPFENICDAITTLAEKYPGMQFVYPVHLNPNVQQVVKERLSGYPNIFLIAPLPYPQLVWLMDQCHFVITDSGGIQEEAPTLGKPVLVIRDITEREEGIAAGTALLVGTSKERIVAEATKLIDDAESYKKMSKAVNPYGTGDSATQIVKILLKEL